MTKEKFPQDEREKEEEKKKEEEEKKKSAGLRMTGRGEIITEREHKDEIRRRQEHPGREQV